MHIVLSLGGSLINTENGIDHQYIEQIKRIIEKSEASFGIVVGGGTAARKYATEARNKGANEFEADEAAIKATKENASELIKAFGRNACPQVCESFDDARKQAKKYKVVVMGGTIPGITTDADAVLLAEALHAEKVINVSNVDAIYDKDPRKNKDAKRYDTLTHEQLTALAVQSDNRMAGTNFVFDILACKLAARSKIEVHFISGKELSMLKTALEGKKHNGTVVG